jgi:hypothetical protein
MREALDAFPGENLAWQVPYPPSVLPSGNTTVTSHLPTLEGPGSILWIAWFDPAKPNVPKGSHFQEVIKTLPHFLGGYHE